MSKIDDIIADFELLDDWEERYRYLIELGRALDELPESERSEATRVRGCASQVWLVSTTETGPDGRHRLILRGASDAHIVKGLVALVLAIFSGQPVEDVAKIDPDAIFRRIDLREHLTPQRSNGVNSMIERIRRDAATAAA